MMHRRAYQPAMGSWFSKAKNKVIKSTPFFEKLNPIVAKYGGYVGLVAWIFPPVGLAIEAAVAVAKYEQGRIDFKKATAAALKAFYAAPPEWREVMYLEANPEVAKGVKAGTLRSGWAHYVDVGYAAGAPVAPGQKIAPGGAIVTTEQPAGAPANWNDVAYLAANPDLEPAMKRGDFSSGFDHYQKHGKAEGRKLSPIAAAATTLPKLNPVPTWWNEAAYLRENPDIAAWIKANPSISGQKTSGWAHWDWFARGGTDRQATRQRIQADKARIGISTAKAVKPATLSLVNTSARSTPSGAAASSSTMLIAGGALLLLLALKGNK